MADYSKGNIRYSSFLPQTRKKRRSKWLRYGFRLTGVGLIALIVWCLSLYVVITRFDGTSEPDKLRRADVGIVLGATLWNDKPSPGLRERLDHSLNLYQQGLYGNFIVTGGLDNNGATITEAEGMRNYLMEHGVPEQSIVMDSLSRSTYENLSFAQEIMDSQDWQSAIIVTHSYHGSRAADIASTLDYEPVQVSVTDSSVLKMSYHETREVLAYTKWLAMKMFL